MPLLYVLWLLDDSFIYPYRLSYKSECGSCLINWAIFYLCSWLNCLFFHINTNINFFIYLHWLSQWRYFVYNVLILRLEITGMQFHRTLSLAHVYIRIFYSLICYILDFSELPAPLPL